VIHSYVLDIVPGRICQKKHSYYYHYLWLLMTGFHVPKLLFTIKIVIIIEFSLDSYCYFSVVFVFIVLRNEKKLN
jgi:hypothetical protein